MTTPSLLHIRRYFCDISHTFSFIRALLLEASNAISCHHWSLDARLDGLK